MFTHFKFISKTNVGAALAALGVFLRATGNSDVADVIDQSSSQLQGAIPEVLQAVGALLAVVGIGHKIDKQSS